MTTLITLLLLVGLLYALIRYARHDGIAAPYPYPDPRDELDHIRPGFVLG